MTLDNDTIIKYIEQLEKQSKALSEEVVRICWWMRGSIGFEEAYMLSPLDKKHINKLIEENIEHTKKTKISFI